MVDRYEAQRTVIEVAYDEQICTVSIQVEDTYIVNDDAVYLACRKQADPKIVARSDALLERLERP